MAKVKGKITYVGTKWTGSLRIEGHDTWFNGSEDTAEGVKNCKAGEVVELTTETDNKGKERIVQLTKLDNVNSISKPASSFRAYDGDPKRQSYIVRQNCLGHAVELVVGFKTELAEEENFSAIETVKRLAEDLEKWVLR